MLIGNKLRFAIEARPVAPSWEVRYPPEKGGWAALSIWIDGANLCENVRSGEAEVREEVYVPLGPISDWLVHALARIRLEERPHGFQQLEDAHQTLREWGRARPAHGISVDDWFDVREDWWRGHFLAAGADGAELPNLAFVRDDEQLVMSWATPARRQSGAPRFLVPEGRTAVPWSDGAEVLARFVAEVAGSLRQAGLGSVYPWTSAEEPLASEALDIEEAILLFTGRTREEMQAFLDVGDAGQLLRELGLSASADPAESPIAQVLRDLSPVIPKQLAPVLRELDAATKGPSAGAWLRLREVVTDSTQAAAGPENAGCLAAEALRDHLRLGTAPIDDVREVLRALDVELHQPGVLAGQERMITAGRRGGRAVAVLLDSRRTKTSWGFRFEAVRALGHLLLNQMRTPALGAASGPFAGATRRRRSGAFAAEFLLPNKALEVETRGLVDAAADPRVFSRILERYQVGARTAAQQLYNRGWLSTTSMRDELIEQFAHTPKPP